MRAKTLVAIVIFVLISAVSVFIFIRPKVKKTAVIARAGKAEITQEDIDYKKTDIAQDYLPYLDTQTGRQQFVNILLREKLILLDCADMGITASAEYKEKVSSFADNIARRVKEYADTLAYEMWKEDLEKRGIITVSENEVKNYYAKYPNEIYLSHILLDDPKKAEEILRQIKSGADFGETAARVSLDKSTAGKKGEIPPFIVGELYIPSIENAANGISVNELQGVFKSRFGYHIIKKREQKRLSFNAAKKRIVKVITKQKMDKYIAELAEKYPLEVVDERYK